MVAELGSAPVSSARGGPPLVELTESFPIRLAHQGKNGIKKKRDSWTCLKVSSQKRKDPLILTLFSLFLWDDLISQSRRSSFLGCTMDLHGNGMQFARVGGPTLIPKFIAWSPSTLLAASDASEPRKCLRTFAGDPRATWAHLLPIIHLHASRNTVSSPMSRLVGRDSYSLLTERIKELPKKARPDKLFSSVK